MHWTKWAGEDLIKPSEAYDQTFAHKPWVIKHEGVVYHCLLYTSDAADERSSVDLGGRRIIKKKNI